MTSATRRFSIATTVLALVVAACGTTGPSGSPSLSPSAGPSASPPASASLPPTTAPSPTVEPSTAPPSSPSTSPSASSSAAACVLVPSTGQLPSDRLVDVKVSTSGEADRLTFVFGNPSLPGPAGPPEGSLAVAKAPFTQAGSGAAIDLVGDHAVQIRFSGMSLANDAGEETYQGSREFKPDLAALRHTVLYDESEGIVGWYVGYDGRGCVTLDRNGNDVILTIAHG